MKKTVTHYELNTEKIPESEKPVRIAFLTDLHNCTWGEHNRLLLSLIKAEKPDLVLCGGDIITAHPGTDMEEGLSLIRRLSASPDTAVTLVEGRDDLCAACPHMAGSRCASEEKVNRLDRGVLEACGFSAGETHSWSALARTAREQVLEKDTFEKVCGCCEWFELCRATRRGWIYGTED